MKHKKYFWWLFSGSGCFLLFFNLIDGVSAWFTILIEIISIFAGGVFGSTVVAIFVEKINEKYAKIKAQKQKKIILQEMVTSLSWLIKRELTNFNDVYYMLINDSEITKKKVSMNICEAIDKLSFYLDKSLAKYFDFSIPIDQNYMDKQKKIENEVFDSCLGYYQGLSKYFKEKIQDKEYYYQTQDILEQKDIEVLNLTFGWLDDIVEKSKEKNFEVAVDFKIEFFKGLKDFIEYFNLKDYYSGVVYNYYIYQQKQ